MKYSLAALALLLISACSNHPCRQINTEGVPESILKSPGERNVSVYKYDGTRQCGQGQEISLDSMSKELRDIKIISMSKKNDGQMRIQVCGAASGYANVYEILEKDLKKLNLMDFNYGHHDKKLQTEVQKFRQLPERLQNAGYEVEIFDELSFALKSPQTKKPYNEKKEYQYFLCALVHGNEVGGVSLLNYFAENLMLRMEKNFHSYVFCLGNLAAGLKGVRFIERDLNRSFLSETQEKHEEKLALRIGNLAQKCAYSLDLHQTNQDSLYPFMIFVYSEERMRWARHLNSEIPIITSIKERHKDGSTLDMFCFKNETINLTLELGIAGFYHKQEAFGLQFLNQTLKALPKETPVSFSNVYGVLETVYWEDERIILNPGFLNFSPIKKDALVGKIGDRDFKSSFDGVILFPKYGEIAKNTKEVFTVAQTIEGLEDL